MSLSPTSSRTTSSARPPKAPLPLSSAPPPPSSPPRTSTATQTRSSTPTINQARTRLTASLARSTSSASALHSREPTLTPEADRFSCVTVSTSDRRGLGSARTTTRETSPISTRRFVFPFQMPFCLPATTPIRNPTQAHNPAQSLSSFDPQNKHFNKKLERYYNTHTKEIRDNFERGTAL